MDPQTSRNYRRDVTQTDLTDDNAISPILSDSATSTNDSESTTGACIASTRQFRFQRQHSTASGETLHSGTAGITAETTHTRQTSRDSGLFWARSLDSRAETICGAAEDDIACSSLPFHRSRDDVKKALGKSEQQTGIPGPSASTHRRLRPHRLAARLKKYTFSAKLARSARKVCSYRPKGGLPPPVTYAEPQYSLVGDMKTVRFDDCVRDSVAPCTDWDDVECMPVLIVGRDPTLPVPESNRSSMVGGLRNSFYGMNRISRSFHY